MLRNATSDDLGYFIQAGREFCEQLPFNFDADSYAGNFLSILSDPSCIVVVEGDPATGHAAAKLMPSLYDDTELIARVFTTWGKGGLKCFSHLESLCRKRGAAFLVTDSLVEPRIAKFYERRGMKRADSLFMKEL